MSEYKPRHSHPYFRAAEDRLPKHRGGRRILADEPSRAEIHRTMFERTLTSPTAAGAS